MKKLVSLILCVLFVIPLISCSADSPELEIARGLVIALDDVASLDNLDRIASVGMQVSRLSDDELKKLNPKKLERIENDLLEMPHSPIFCVNELRKQIKDPASFRLYGNILCAVRTLNTGETLYLYEIAYDGKNDFGAYPGKSLVTASCSSAGKNEILFPGEAGYFNVTNFLSMHTPEQLEKEGIEYFYFSGKRIAAVIGCEYME